MSFIKSVTSLPSFPETVQENNLISEKDKQFTPRLLKTHIIYIKL